MIRLFLVELGDDEVLRLIRIIRMYGVLDECVFILKEGSVWKIILCSEKKKNVLIIEVSNLFFNK